MATLIICPACETRYETKAVFPPGGRKVRCAKCAHVWQALPVAAAPEAPRMAPTPPQPAPAAMPLQMPPAPPQPAAAVNVAMHGFAGITPAAPQTETSFPPAATNADAGPQGAKIGAAALAGAGAATPPGERGGIFARLGGYRATAPSAPLPDAGMRDASMRDADFGDSAMMGALPGNGSMADDSMGDAGMGIDPALAAQAFPDEQASRKRPSPVAIGWLALGLVVAVVIGTFAFAPSAVMAVLPGASRLYAMFGMGAGSRGLSFESVRYGWATEGGQTVLEVQGDVVNNTSSAANVPTVVIALRDEGGVEISQWTTEVGEAELKAGEHAPFLRQIPSPPSNVHSVEVRFAKAE